MTIETPHDLQGLLTIGRIVAQTLQSMRAQVRPGMTTQELDDHARHFLDRHHARSAPMLAVNFPRTTCISINEEAAHGIPSERRIQSGDLVKLDVSAELHGYYADHEAPRNIPHFHDRSATQSLTEGMVLAIEPHLAAGDGRLIDQADGWTICTRDRSPVAAYEHTIVVTQNQPIIITAA